MLIPFTSVARIENNVAAAVVQARLVSTDFARLAEHPVLRQTISINTSGSPTSTDLPTTGEILTAAITKKKNEILHERLEIREKREILPLIKFILTHGDILSLQKCKIIRIKLE